MASAHRIQTLRPNVLTVSVFTGFEPFAFYLGGELVGFDIEILGSFALDQGLETSFIAHRQFNNIWLRPGRNESDLAAAGIAMFEERLSETVAWSDPYYEVQRSILVHEKDVARLRTIEDFEGRSIAFVAGSTADLDTRARAPGDSRLVPIDNQPQGMRLLRSRQVDGLAMGAPSNTYNRLIHPGFALIDVHEFTQPEGLRFAVSAANTSFLDALNAFIGRATEDGRIAAQLARWMSAPG